MALGARKAIQEIGDTAVRERLLRTPFLGIDGVPKTGQSYVNRALLTGTIIVPANSGKAIEMLSHAVTTGTMPPERTLTATTSYPSLEDLARKAIRKAQAAGR
jgi:ABC-type sugar transport system substrate-binding protein